MSASSVSSCAIRIAQEVVPLIFKGLFYALLLAALILPGGARAAKRGRLIGIVTDVNSGLPIEKVLVAIQGTDLSTLTDKEGKFNFDLEEGVYSISLWVEEYYNSNYQDIEIAGGEVTTYSCEMVPGDPRQAIFFSIGGINVLDRRELLPEELATTYEITSDIIDHQLSTNLGDVLTLIPGVERTTAPGLSERSQVELRGSGNMPSTSEKTAALFGTKVLIDEMNLSNNANLQSGTGTAIAKTSTDAGTGIDVRTIPADNIERVEVITGVPSVEYGDMTTGLVKVETKMGRQPQRLKFKSNPDTKEASLTGGVPAWGNTGISYTLNYAYSERDIRREGDEYSRYNGQLTFKNKFKGGTMNLMNKFYYTGVMDENNLDPSDPLALWQYNKGYTFMYGNTFDFKPSRDTKVEWRGNLKYAKKDSYYQKLTGADTRILTTAMEPGTNVGILDAGAYVSKIWTKGEEWNFNAKLNFRYDFRAFWFDNSLLLGGEYSYDDNVGQGKIFNPLEPPYGNPGYRPLPYDDVPALQTANLYIEDELNGFVKMKPYTVNLGLRYEMYTPYKFNADGIFGPGAIIESKNGTYINPRIRAKLKLFQNTQLRFGWGKSSKMPSMTSIWQGPEYIDLVEENFTPPDSVPLVSTYVFNYDNTRLVGYQSEKLEASLDQKIGSVGLIFTGFFDKGSNMPRGVDVPLTLYRYSWTDYPDPSSATVIDTLYAKSGNRHGYYNPVGWFEKYGLEFELRTKRIESISTQFYITASYIKTTSGADGTYMSSPIINSTVGRTIYPYYYYNQDWRQKLILNYNASWFVRRVGIWVTFFVQQTLFDENQKKQDPIVYSVGYWDPESNSYVPITREQSAELGLDRNYSDTDVGIYRRPNDRLLFNINVSKSIGRGAEVTFFVHNLFDDLAYYVNEFGNYSSRNHAIFYGVGFSMILDELWKKQPSIEGVK
jgi:hypothetical protein